MANVKVTALTALTAADSAATDVLPIVDVSADATKKLAISDLHRSVPDGTLSAPGIAFQSDLNSGLYRSGTDAIALVTNGAARILIDATGNVTIPNDLTVQGATTFITGQTVLIEDKNIELGVVSTPTDVTANGGGITLKGTTDKTIQWIDSTNAWTFNNKISVQTSVSGSVYAELTTTGSALGLSANLTAGSSASDSVALNFKTSNSGSETTKMRINPDGKVGIGTTGPLDSLSVASANYRGLTLETSTLANRPTITFRNTAGSGASAYIQGNNNQIAFGTVNSDYGGHTEKMRIDSSGNLLIKTGEIDLQGGNKTIKTSAGFLQVGTSGSHHTAFITGGTERMRIDSSGRLLVGTNTYTGNGQVAIAGNSSGSSAAGILDIRPTLSRPTATDTTLSLIRFGGADHTSNTAYASINVSSDGASASDSDLPGRLEFHTTPDGDSSPVERMRIASNGTSFFQSDENVIGAMSEASAGTAVRLYYGSHSSTGISGTVSYTVWTNGNVVNTNNSYGSLSDAKLKDNIVDANSQWNDLKAIQVRNYNFIEGQTHTQIGVVAQEVETVSPGLVSESPDRDEEGNDLGTVTKSVNYSVLYMKAVKALQEAMERIETLEAKVAALEGV